MKDHKLKIKENVTFNRSVKVKDHLNLGRKVVTQTLNNNNQVTINSSSGIITMNSIIPPSTTYHINVINNKVQRDSVILLSLMNDDVPIVYLSATSVIDGMFVLNVNNPNGAPTAKVQSISFLIC